MSAPGDEQQEIAYDPDDGGVEAPGPPIDGAGQVAERDEVPLLEAAGQPETGPKARDADRYE